MTGPNGRLHRETHIVTPDIISRDAASAAQRVTRRRHMSKSFTLEMANCVPGGTAVAFAVGRNPECPVFVTWEARMRRVAFLIVTLGVMAPVLPAARGGQAHGENLVLVEESRLPPDTSPAATSTTDVDLVDVDGDGDLDIYKARAPTASQGDPINCSSTTAMVTSSDESGDPTAARRRQQHQGRFRRRRR